MKIHIKQTTYELPSGDISALKLFSTLTSEVKKRGKRMI